MSFKLSPVPILETIEAGSRRRCPGIDVAVQRLITFAHLLPLADGEAIPVTPGHQLLGTQLL